MRPQLRRDRLSLAHKRRAKGLTDDHLELADCTFTNVGLSDSADFSQPCSLGEKHFRDNFCGFVRQRGTI